MGETYDPNNTYEWDGYRNVRVGGGDTGHLDLRGRAWQLDTAEEKARYRSLMRMGVGEAEAFMRVTDGLYEAHCRAAERLDIEPLKPSQWMECRAFRDQTNGDLDAIVAQYMKRLRRRADEAEEPATHSAELARAARIAADAEDPDYEPKYPWLDSLSDEELAEEGVAPAQVKKGRPAGLEGYRQTRGAVDEKGRFTRPSMQREARAAQKRKERARQREAKLAEYEAFHGVRR